MKIFSEKIKVYANTIGDRNEVDNALILPIFLQNIVGQNVLNPNWSWKTTFKQQMFIIFLNIYVIFGTKEYLQDATDVKSIGEAYYTMLIMIFFFFKYMLFINNREPFRILYMIAKTTLIKMIRENSNEKANKFLKQLKRLVTVLFFACVLFPVIMYLLAAMWNYINGIRVTLSKTTSILMPMTSPYYEFGLILHTIFLFIMAFTYSTVDVWFVILMLFFCMTSDSVENVLKVDCKGTDETDLDYMDRLNNTLRIFYKNHMKLMEFFNILSDTYKWPIVIPLVSVLLGLCMILFLMSAEVEWIFLSNLLPTVTQIFAYNWLGEQVKLKGTQLNTALLNFDWTSMRVKDRKNYLILISYMDKELSIRTALGYELSMVTMTSVFKASYQAFAVLKTMES